jgi:hypothetical protein
VFSSRFMPCPHCGQSVDTSPDTVHRCDPERRLDHQMFRLRDDIAAFDAQLHTYLDTSMGRFETWLAARDVRSGAG